MRIVQISDVHIWRYVINPLALFNKRAVGMASLLAGRARRFRLDRISEVVRRIEEVGFDHLIITGDLTTTALEAEFRQAHEQLGSLLADPSRVTAIPGNHDRYTIGSVRTRAFERHFGRYMPRLEFPWLRWIDDQTAILGLDATRSHLSATGILPDTQLEAARRLLSDGQRIPRRMLIACHYPTAAPATYSDELHHKRLLNSKSLKAWLATLPPHIYLCGHVHAAWAFHPEGLPNELCLNSGAPLLRDRTGRRPPGFLEIDLTDETVSVVHHAWTGTQWSIFPLVTNLWWWDRQPASQPAST